MHLVTLCNAPKCIDLLSFMVCYFVKGENVCCTHFTSDCMTENVL